MESGPREMAKTLGQTKSRRKYYDEVVGGVEMGGRRKR
jgi:hypothetical protein